MGLQRVRHDWASFTFSRAVVIGRIQVGCKWYPPHGIYNLILPPPLIASHLKAHLLIKRIQQKPFLVAHWLRLWASQCRELKFNPWLQD